MPKLTLTIRSRTLRLVLATSLTLGFVGCCSKQVQKSPPPVPAPSAAQVLSPPAPSEVEGSAPPVTLTPGAPTTHPAFPKGFVQGKRPLLPPSEAGKARSRIAGCLQDAAAGDAAGSRYPAAVTRGASAPPVRVVVLGTGLVVHHDLRHACCLSGEVETQVAGSELRVRVLLTGSPCRCMCRSTLATAVGLALGSYHVVVEVEEGGHLRIVHEEDVQISSKSKKIQGG